MLKKINLSPRELKIVDSFLIKEIPNSLDLKINSSNIQSIFKINNGRRRSTFYRSKE